MHIHIMLVLAVFSGVVAYDKQGLSWKSIKRPYDKGGVKHVIGKIGSGTGKLRFGLRSMPTCRTKFLLSTCGPSEQCSSGRLCMDTTRALCCIPAVHECPTPLQLGFDCVVRAPVNWCTQNEDCGVRKCCPTGCNYNICM
ncbi:hypothetical protein OESDEN_02158 [Oesophagostomum dentatum]|uniref:WAP domain-containing protein n=1 Tax=Oesophagostomum dentatum TaxID=61180 RepID=A0A0B1TP30_OESDE|nr:hypothetical protein OESDEN_02158 [Oesophagostomum dentatum]